MTKAASLEIKRHVQHLSEKGTDELVCAMADIFVAYVKRHGSGGQETDGEPENIQPQKRKDRKVP